jgi:hypothetical protein
LTPQAGVPLPQVPCTNAHNRSDAAPVGIRITQPNGQNPPSLIHRRNSFPMK